MARITIEDCLAAVENRFGLVHLSSQRARQLVKGSAALIRAKNKHIVIALREIAAKKVEFARILDEKLIRTA